MKRRQEEATTTKGETEMIEKAGGKDRETDRMKRDTERGCIIKGTGVRKD
jgi:hypothetical protein